MSYYIQGASGQFISGLYYTEADARRGIEKYIEQQAKRYTTNIDRIKEMSRLRQSLKVVLNTDGEPPAQAVYTLRDEILKKIENDNVGTIYNEPLLIGMIRTRILGLNGTYYEVTPMMRKKALTTLFNPVTAKKSRLLVEKDGIITRTKEMLPYSLPINGLFKSYLHRV